MGVDQHYTAAGALEMMRGPGSEDSGPYHCNIEVHYFITCTLTPDIAEVE